MQFDPTKPIVLCRSAAPPEPIARGAHLGFSCLDCGKPLQITPESYQLARHGANLLCNACGNPLMDALTKNPPPGGLEVRVQPSAVEQIERLEGKPIREVYPDAEHVKFDPRDYFRAPR